MYEDITLRPKTPAAICSSNHLPHPQATQLVRITWRCPACWRQAWLKQVLAAVRLTDLASILCRRIPHHSRRLWDRTTVTTWRWRHTLYTIRGCVPRRAVERRRTPHRRNWASVLEVATITWACSRTPKPDMLTWRLLRFVLLVLREMLTVLHSVCMVAAYHIDRPDERMKMRGQHAEFWPKNAVLRWGCALYAWKKALKLPYITMCITKPV